MSSASFDPLFKPRLQGGDDRGRVLLSRGEPSLWRHAAHRRLDGVERSDLAHGGFGDRGLGVARQLHKSAAQMAPAMDELPWSLRPLQTRQPVIALIGVNLQVLSAEALEEAFGMLAAAPGRIVEQHDGRTLATMAAIIAGNRPEEALLDLAASGIEHRRRGLVHEQSIRASQMPAHVAGHGLEMEAGSASPVAQCRTIQLDALASVDFGLPVRCCAGDYVAEAPDLPEFQAPRSNLRNIIF